MLQKHRDCSPNHTANSKNLNLDETGSSALLDELEAFSSNPEQTDLDADALIACLDQLDRLYPTDESFDTEASLSAFQAQHAEAFPGRKTSKRRRTMPRRARWLVAAVAALLVSGILLAQAFNTDLSEIIAHWTDETLHFELEKDISSEDSIVTAAENPQSFYSTFEKALLAYGFTDPVAPTWVPDGFALSSQGVTATIGDSGIHFHALSHGDAGAITVDIQQFNNLSDIESISYEKDSNDLYTIQAGGNVHYLFRNNDRMVSAWVNGHMVCMISGDVSEKQLLKMIASIYEGGE